MQFMSTINGSRGNLHSLCCHAVSCSRWVRHSGKFTQCVCAVAVTSWHGIFRSPKVPSHITGWWFGTFFIFPYIWNNHPNWRIHIFQRGRALPPTRSSRIKSANRRTWRHTSSNSAAPRMSICPSSLVDLVIRRGTMTWSHCLKWPSCYFHVVGIGVYWIHI